MKKSRCAYCITPGGNEERNHDFRRHKYLQYKRENEGVWTIIYIFYTDYTLWGETAESDVRLKYHTVIQPKHFIMFL